ncbi:MAG: hypothetical protein GW949_08355 [Spirochaetales bacterium]|nr:hypothetical protein [Spirochaetales bacterium]
MDGVRDFWRKKEESLGTPILSRSLAQVTYGLGYEYPVWGLFYCTQDRLYFEYKQKESWMFTTASRDTEPLVYECSLRKDVTFVAPPEQVGQGWCRWFTPKSRRSYGLKESSSSKILLQFTLEQDDSDLGQVLSRLLTSD